MLIKFFINLHFKPIKSIKITNKIKDSETFINSIYVSHRYMDDLLLHIRVSKKLKEQLQVLIDSGYFNNQTEIVREGIRNVLMKYKDEIGSSGSQENSVSRSWNRK